MDDKNDTIPPLHMQYLQGFVEPKLQASLFTGTLTPLEINLSKTDFPAFVYFTTQIQHKHDLQSHKNNNYLNKSIFTFCKNNNNNNASSHFSGE